MRLIHSSDLQIGKVFKYFEPEVAALLQDARQASVRTLGELAVKHGAAAVLLAGDVYEKQQISPQTLAKPIEGMRQFPKVTWHLMPGNHDHFRENGLWDRLLRTILPENVKLHTRPGAVKIMGDVGTPVFLLPAPLAHISHEDDLTDYMDKEATRRSHCKEDERPRKSRVSQMDLVSESSRDFSRMSSGRRVHEFTAESSIFPSICKSSLLGVVKVTTDSIEHSFRMMHGAEGEED